VCKIDVHTAQAAAIEGMPLLMIYVL